MKFVKILSLILALLMVGGAMVACGGGNETEAPAGNNSSDVTRDPIRVSIHVRRTADGEDVYVTDGYDFVGQTCTVSEILAEFMSFEYGIDVVYDAAGKLKTVGEIDLAAGQLWLFSIAKPPKGPAQAEPVDANIETYGAIENNDVIVIYLGGAVAE